MALFRRDINNQLQPAATKVLRPPEQHNEQMMVLFS